MDDVKTFLESRTVWANFIGLFALVATISGLEFGQEDVDKVVDAALKAVAALSFIASTAFRVLATKRIGG